LVFFLISTYFGVREGDIQNPMTRKQVDYAALIEDVAIESQGTANW